MHTTTGTLTPTPPFDFAKSLNFFGTFLPIRGEQRLEEATLTKAVSIEGNAVVFELKSTGTLEQPFLHYTLYSAQPLTQSVMDAATDRITFFLSLNDDLRPFYELAAQDPAFVQVIDRLYGYHQVKFITAFENAIWAILTQRSSMSLGQKIKQRLTDDYGVSLEVNGLRYQAFPEAIQLLKVPPDELAAIIRNEQKMPYINSALANFANVDEQFLRHAPYDQVEAWLRDIKGIGEWSASFVLIRALGRMDKALTGDERLRQAAAKLYGRTFNDKDLHAYAERYGPHKGYWAHYVRVGA
jgi:DNA-3-methyladenine glycosylase II